MTIKTKFKICMAIIGIIFGVAVVLMGLASRQVNRGMAHHKFAESIAEASGTLNVLAFEYVVHGGERIQQQWLTMYEQIIETIDDQDDLTLKSSILSLHSQLETSRFYFDHLTRLDREKIYHKPLFPGDGDGLVRISSYFLSSQETLLQEALLIGEQSMAQQERAVRMFTRVFVYCLAAVMSVAGIMFYIFAAGIAGPLSTLDQGMRRVGSGELDFRIPIHNRDEIGMLAGAFNEMAEKLKTAREQLMLYKKFAEQANQGFGIGSFDGTIRYVNNALAGMIGGITREEFIGKSFVPIYPEEFQKTITSEVIPQLLEKGAWKGELALTDHEGRVIPTLENYSVIKDDHGEPHSLAVVISDITEQKNHEKKMAQYAECLKTANRELESFAYSVSHDLRTPLRAMEGFSKILLKEHASQLDKEGLRVLNVVVTNVRRMALLIDNLLKFSRTDRQAMALTEIDMLGLAESAFEAVSAASKSNRLHFRNDSPPPARADRILIREVLINLFGNAVKYGKHEGPVVIEFGGSREKGCCTYYVRDNGIGFDMKYVDKIFGVFQRLHGPGDYEGTGIGLALVQRIISRHGGRVWARGTPDKGATFSFTLPAGTKD